MESNLIEKNQGGCVVAKKAYTTPALVIYGKLIELTAAGTGHSNEVHASQKSNKYKNG